MSRFLSVIVWRGFTRCVRLQANENFGKIENRGKMRALRSRINAFPDGCRHSIRQNMRPTRMSKNKSPAAAGYPRSARTPPWTAAPGSDKPYYPFALGNGSDCITIGYTGSMCGSRGHQEEHQGLVAGWYKYAHRVYHIPAKLRKASLLGGSPGIETGMASPILQAGYKVIVDGESAGVTDYRQAFDAREAVISTAVTLRDVFLTVTSFLTDEHLWVESIAVAAAPAHKTVDLALFLNEFTLSRELGLMLRRQSILKIAPRPAAGELKFEYHLSPNDVHGGGRMWAAPAGRAIKNEIVYSGVKAGFTVTRYLLAVDDAETPAWRAAIKRIGARWRKHPPGAIRAQHAAIWRAYAGRSSLRVPDPWSRGLYDFSMYWMRANQYPKNGSLNLGPFAYHWGGGCNAIPDAWSMQMALLTANRVDESRYLLDFYRTRMPRARLVAKALGLPGARFCYFASAAGQDYHADPEKIRTEKVGANAMVCYSFYDHWLASGRDDDLPEALSIMRELLDHILAAAVIEKSDRAYIGVTKPSCEIKLDVSNDTMISIWVARALRGYCEMAEAGGQPVPAEYRRIAAKLPKGLLENYRDGILMPFRNAKFYSGGTQSFFFNLPYGIDRKSVLRCIKAGKTPFGYDGDTYIGNIRHWPWSYCFQSLVYSHWGWAEKSFACLQNVLSDCSALGAMPEKIRIDGYPVNYYYTSAHAYYLWALQTALCHDRKNDCLALLAGMDGTWRDLEFRDLRMKGGLLVSVKVRKCRVCKLAIKNDGTRPARRKLLLNPRYAGQLPGEIRLQAGQSAVWG